MKPFLLNLERTYKDDDEELSARIRACRAYLGFTLYDVAKRSGLQEPVLSRIENSKVEPSPDHVGAIAKAFGVEPKDLVWGLPKYAKEQSR